MQDGEFGVVRAQSFRLRSEEGDECEVLTMIEGQPALVLGDREGTTRARIRLDAEGRPSVAFSDQNGEVRAWFGLGAGEQPCLALSDGSGRTRIRLRLDGGDQPCIELLDDDGRDPKAHLALAADGGVHLELADGTGGPGLAIEVGGDGRHAVTFGERGAGPFARFSADDDCADLDLADRNGCVRASLGVSCYRGPSLMFWDGDLCDDTDGRVEIRWDEHGEPRLALRVFEEHSMPEMDLAGFQEMCGQFRSTGRGSAKICTPRLALEVDTAGSASLEFHDAEGKRRGWVRAGECGWQGAGGSSLECTARVVERTPPE